MTDFHDEPTTVLSFGHYCLNPENLPPARPRFTSEGELRILSPSRVLEAVADTYNLSVAKLRSKDRSKVATEARTVCFWLLRTQAKKSLNEAKILLNRRDHSSAIVAFRRCERMRKTDAEFRTFTDRLVQQLQKGAAA